MPGVPFLGRLFSQKLAADKAVAEEGPDPASHAPRPSQGRAAPRRSSSRSSTYPGGPQVC